MFLFDSLLIFFFTFFCCYCCLFCCRSSLLSSFLLLLRSPSSGVEAGDDRVPTVSVALSVMGRLSTSSPVFFFFCWPMGNCSTAPRLLFLPAMPWLWLSMRALLFRCFWSCRKETSLLRACLRQLLSWWLGGPPPGRPSWSPLHAPPAPNGPAPPNGPALHALHHRSDRRYTRGGRTTHMVPSTIIPSPSRSLTLADLFCPSPSDGRCFRWR
jgi:hypothetical protein